jgi:hypothetical protein
VFADFALESVLTADEVISDHDQARLPAESVAGDDGRFVAVDGRMYAGADALSGDASLLFHR